MVVGKRDYLYRHRDFTPVLHYWASYSCTMNLGMPKVRSCLSIVVSGWKLTELCPADVSDIFRESFPNALRLPRLMNFACVRECCPLISQLIQENKIPEFGEYLFDRNSVWADRFVQTTCTSISTAFFTTVSLILQYNPLILWPFHQARIQTTGMPTSGYPRSKYSPPYSPTSITFSER